MLKIFAHRGSPKKAPENTILSFEKSIKEKAYAIEFDVWKGPANNLYVIHDESLYRTTGKKIDLKKQNFSTIRNILVKKRNKKERQQRIPLLEEVLLLAKDSGIKVNIELKEKYIIFDIIKLLERFEMINQGIISSFFYIPLLISKDIIPKLKTAFLINEIPADLKEKLIETKVDYLHANYDFVTKDVIDLAHSMKKCVNIFTINSTNHLRKSLLMGCDGIFTENVPHIKSCMSKPEFKELYKNNGHLK